MDADKKSRTSEMVFEGLTFRGIAAIRDSLATLEVSLMIESLCSLFPPLMATKIWRLSAGRDLPEVEEVADEDRERMMTRLEGSRW